MQGAGGSDGPAVIQLHTPVGTQGALQLPAGLGLEALTAPDAVVLLPALRRARGTDHRSSGALCGGTPP